MYHVMSYYAVLYYNRNLGKISLSAISTCYSSSTGPRHTPTEVISEFLKNRPLKDVLEVSGGYARRLIG
jgi:hypothetical protein